MCSLNVRHNFEWDHQLKNCARLVHVPRWSTVPVIRRQSVAEHSYMVAVIAKWLIRYNYERATPHFEQMVLAYALAHDANESIEGDVPSPRKGPPKVDPNNQVHVMVKCADYLEAFMYVKSEQTMGNKFMNDQIWFDLHSRLHPWWDAFKWDCEPFTKPFTSDVVRILADTLFDMKDLHPGMSCHE